MLTMMQLEGKLKELKPILSEKYHISLLGYFGSYAIGKQTPQSDLDIIVDFNEPVGYEFFDIAPFIESQLGIKIDLSTPRSIKKRLRGKILPTVKYV